MQGLVPGRPGGRWALKLYEEMSGAGGGSSHNVNAAPSKRLRLAATMSSRIPVLRFAGTAVEAVSWEPLACESRSRMCFNSR
jgi:hypothetical protein